MNRALRQSPSADGVRDVDGVPFVELFDGRVQGVASSGSDPNRVYVNFVRAGTLTYYCSTNNNKQCNGFGGGPCKHIGWMIEEAVAQFGGPAVARYLKLPVDPDTVTSAHEVLRHIRGGIEKTPMGEAFARFLFDLRFVELDAPEGCCPEMAWFVG